METADLLTLVGISLLVTFGVVLIGLILARKRIVFWWRVLRDFGRWSWRTLKDPEAPLAARVVPLALLGYLLFPIDGLPDVLPVLGQLDDLGLIILGLHFLLSPERAARIEAKWPGSRSTLEALHAFAIRKKTR